MIFEVDHVVRKIQVLGHAFGVVDVVERTTAMLCGAGALQFGQTALIPELHGEAEDVAVLLVEQCCNRGAVDASGHGYRHRVGFGGCGDGKCV